MLLSHNKNNKTFIQIVTIIICELSIKCLVKSQQQISVPNSPCPNLFSYDYDNSRQQIFGRMTIPSPQLGGRLKINLEMSLPSRLPSVGFSSLYLYILLFS